MRRVALVVAGACGTAAPVAPPHPAVARVPATVAPHPAPQPLRASITSSPAGTIEAIAVTADGRAAVATDTTGGMRLWPALDGSKEPVIVDLPSARELALARHGDDFDIALRDDVGGLVIATVDAGGRTLAHASLAAEPAFTGLAATSHGVLAWRADHVVVEIGSDGAIRARLPVEPGQQLVDVGTNATRAVALVRDGNNRLRARLVEVGDGKLAWGAWIDGDFGDAIALSPSGKYIATLVAPTNSTMTHVRVVDLAGTKVEEQAASERGELGFVDDDNLVVGGTVTATWVSRGGLSTQRSYDNTRGMIAPPRDPAFAVAAGIAVAGWGADLVLSTPTTTEYLGYGLVAPNAADAMPGGRLLVGAGDRLAVLDADLALAPVTYSLPANASLYAARAMPDGGVLAQATTYDGKVSLLYAGSDGKSIVLRQLTSLSLLAFEPATDVVTLSYGDKPEVLHFDRQTHALASVGTLARPSQYAQRMLVPLAPERAGGGRLVAIDMTEHTHITWSRDDLGNDVIDDVKTDGSAAAVDRAGRVYLWQNVGAKLELHVVAPDKHLTTIDTAGVVALGIDPMTGRVAASGMKGLTVFEPTGVRLWHREVDTAGALTWLDDGALALVTSTGIVRFDGATGKLLAARCGWLFGRSMTVHFPTTPAAPVCTAARHW